MATLTEKINCLFAKEEWGKARRLLQAELVKAPTDHWIVTQLGVTFYEQKRYEESLQLFRRSTQIVPDCPLTLWNLAGTFDATGDHANAIEIYTWLVNCTTSPDEDPCWESEEWADALKTNSVYRLGVCFQNSGNSTAAEFCYRQYIDLLLIGVEGSYSIEDARRHIQSLHGADNGRGAEVELKKLKAYLARHGSTAKRRSPAKTKSAS
jgi:tetratricopeptide (TPR) repeat protein